MSTFVSVGNATQPFPRLLQAVVALAPMLPQPLFVQYGAANGFVCDTCTAAAFISMDEFSARVSAAQLLILHAGAGSVIHAVRAGKVPVVVPRLGALGEHVDDHQIEFARELARLGRIVVCEDMGQLAAAVQAALHKQAASASAMAEQPLVGLVRSLLLAHVATIKGDAN